jgi:hypothetical protein
MSDFVLNVSSHHRTNLSLQENVFMDFHRDSRGQDTRNGRECQFCSSADPEFHQRKPMDRMVQSKLDDSAAAHFTEDGYVRHRIAELLQKRSAISFRNAALLKSA